MASGPDPTGVMIVRIWREDGEEGIRGRLTQTVDITSGQTTTQAAAGVEEIVALVREWVGSFRGGG